MLNCRLVGFTPVSQFSCGRMAGTSISSHDHYLEIAPCQAICYGVGTGLHSAGSTAYVLSLAGKLLHTRRRSECLLLPSGEYCYLSSALAMWTV